MLFDIIPIITVIIFIIAGRHKGFAAALVGAVKWIAALLIAACLAGGIADFVYDRFMAKELEESVAETVRENDEDTNLTAWLDKLLEAVDISNVDEELLLQSEPVLESLGGDEEQITGYICNDIIKPLQLSYIKPICFMAVFVAVMVVLSLVERLLGLVNKIPVLGGANRLLGALLGIVEGAVVACVVCCVLVLLAELNIPLLTPENLADSFIVRPVAETLMK